MSSRIFDPKHRRRYGRPPLAPNRLVIDSPRYNLSKLMYFQFLSHRPRPLWVEKRSLVIATDGACRGNHDRDIKSRASFGVYFGVCSPYNRHGCLDKQLPQTSNRAELEAAIQAIELVDRLQAVLLRERTNKVIIKTDSEWLHLAMTVWIWDWVKSGGKRSNGKPVQHWDAIQALHCRIYDLERQGIHVLFWRVEREFNHASDRLANLALDEADSAYGSSN